MGKYYKKLGIKLLCMLQLIFRIDADNYSDTLDRVFCYRSI